MRNATHQLTLTALLTALICATGPFSIPVGAVPVSLTTAAIMLCSTLLGRRSVVCAALYLLIGAVGMPVFAGFTGGASALIGPTGGFLLAYPLLAYLGGLCCERMASTAGRIGGFTLGTLSLYALGTAWYVHHAHVPVSGALTVCVWPFLPADTLKIALTAPFGKRLRTHLQKAGLISAKEI